NNTGCIKSYLQCDGYDNCRDRSDEIGCRYGSCGSAQFRCSSGSNMGVCIKLTFQCDRNLDCYDGEDENDCACKEKKEFSCFDNGRCIPVNHLCDGDNDCNDGSDENESTCDDSGEIIPRSYVCDGDADCTDESDEVNCTVGPFVCQSSGMTVEREYVCNNVVDCEDASDEYDCFQDASATYVPDVGELLRNYSALSTDSNLYENFVTHHYADNMFGRVVRENPPDWHGFIAYSSSPDYSDLEAVLKLQTGEMNTLGHQLNDFVLDCTFDDVECDMEKDFRTFYDDRYGNCYQYNYKEPDDPDQLLSTKTGVKYGLKLTLFTEQEEYISVYGRDSGARVVIHPPYMTAMPWSEGITIEPGKITSIGIKETRVYRQPAPYGTCVTTTHYETDYGKYYKASACEESCIQDRMMEYCRCVDTMLRNASRCMLLNRTQDTCRQLMYYALQQNILGCECQEACKELYYETSISQSLWPSNTYLKHLLKQIHAENPKTLNINDLESVRQNLIRIELYFDELNFEAITEKPEISEEVLLSSIGGSLGLFCGFSFLTIVEFIQFAFDLVKLTYIRHIFKRLRPVGVTT
ncbi:degenerin unc-8-like, partial [Saccoglossus kowalevskii]